MAGSAENSKSGQADREEHRLPTVEMLKSPANPSPDEAAGTSFLGLRDRDRGLLLAYSSFFFLLIGGQYLWFAWDKPAALPWKRGERFASFRVDVNNATWVDWIQLPGIGQTMAERILADLDRNGPFLSIDDVTRVRGIGPKTLDQIRPWLTISHDDLEEQRHHTDDGITNEQSTADR